MKASLKWLADQGLEVECVVDVGASDGRWSKLAMRYFPNARYILFEPNPIHFKALRSLIAKCQQAHFIEMAVADFQGTIKFVGEDAFGGVISRQPADSDNAIEVAVTTLDASLQNFEGPYLLKLDTHGVEKAILDGASQVIENSSILVIEAYNFRISAEAVLFWELCEYLHDRGFVVADAIDIMHRPLDGAFWQCDLVFVRNSWPNLAISTYD